MPRIVVLGATGHTGPMTVAALRARGADVVACGRNRDALAKLDAAETRIVDVHARDEVRDVLRGADGVANLAGPFLATGHVPIEEAVAQGVPYVDTTGEQAFMLQARERHHASARSAGVPVVNAMAFEYAFADLVTRAHLPDGGETLHVLYRQRGAQGSAGTKKSIVRVLAAPSLGHEKGHLVTTKPGARTHRFGTLDGWRDGISFPGGEILTVPSHTPFRTVRTYVPGPPSRARTVRMLSPLARALLRGPVLRVVERAVDARHEPPRNEQARGEVYLDAGTRHLLVETPDPYLATGEVVAEGITRLADKGARDQRGGVLAPAEAVDAREVLDALAARMPRFGVRRVEVLPSGVARRFPADDKPK